MADDAHAAYQPQLPGAVRRASERANELVRQSAQGGAPQSEATTVEAGAPAGQNPAPASTQEPRNNRSEQQPAPQPREQPAYQQPAQQQPAQQQPAQQQPAQQQPAQQQPVNETTWEQRFNTLQGKYKSEGDALRAQLRALEAANQQTQQLLATLRSQPAPQASAPAASAPASAQPARIAPEDVENYGEDLVTASRRWARAEFEAELVQLREQVGQLSTRSAQTETNLAQRTVEKYLDDNITNWRQTNNDANFLVWLQEVDPFSGRIRQQMLGEAYKNGDAPRTASFFRAYSTEQTAVRPSQQEPTHTPEAGAGRIPLETLAAPGRGPTTSTSQGAPEQRIWSNDQIAAFYRDVNRGKYAGRDAEKLRIEQDIIAAASQGRVR